MGKRDKSRNRRTILFFFLFLWTGILSGFVIKRYCLTKDIEEDIIQMLTRKNLIHIGSLLAAEENKELVPFRIFTGSPLIRYAAEEGAEEEQTGTTAAASISGEGAFFSADTLTNKQEMAKSYFEKADQMLSGASETGESIPVSNIILFNNGSSDITSENQNELGDEREIAEKVASDSDEELAANKKKIEKLFKSYSRSYLLKNFYITDSSTSIDNKIFQVKKMLTMDLALKKQDKPQILILHTHGASEAFIDSKKGTEDSIIGVGTLLAKILSRQYGYQVIHDKTEYDRIGENIDRNKAYNKSLAGAERILKKYPSIEIIIDLHRDGVGNRVKRTTIVDGKKTAQVMFFNGLSRNSSGDIAYLKNPNLQANLAFSLQLKLACMKHFKDFAKPVYLKGYRYNMHLKRRYTLIELGNENNTVAEAKNAAAPLALAIHEVLYQ